MLDVNGPYLQQPRTLFLSLISTVAVFLQLAVEWCFTRGELQKDLLYGMASDNNVSGFQISPLQYLLLR